MKILITVVFILLTLICFSNTVIVQNTNNSGSGSLREAISTSNSNDTIRFNSNLINNGTDTIILLSEISFAKNLVFKGLYNSTDTLYISGGNSNRIFNINFPSNSITKREIIIDSLSLINGFSQYSGGAIHIKYGDAFTIKNSLIYQNLVYTNWHNSLGGGLYYHSTADTSKVTINNSKINNNKVRSDLASGGGIYLYSLNNSIIKINDSKIINNTSDSGNESYGGGICSYSKKESKLLINNSTIINNSIESEYEAYGGGICSFSQNNNSKLHILNSTVSSNTIQSSRESYGGGTCSFSLNDSSIVEIFDTDFSGNEINGFSLFSYSYGGAVSSNGDYSKIKIENSTFNQNNISSVNDSKGGAISSNAQNNSSFTSINNCLINENSAFSNDFSKGGGLYNSSLNGNSVVEINNNCIISNNSSKSTSTFSYGGGIYSFSNNSNSKINLNDSKVISNFSISNYHSSGGGIFSSSNYSSIVINNSSILSNEIFVDSSNVFSNNGHSEGGGLSSYGEYGSSVEIHNSSISSNKVFMHADNRDISGGGLSSRSSSNNKLIISNSDVSENSILNTGHSGASQGGGIYHFSSGDSSITLISNSTISNNQCYSTNDYATGAGLSNLLYSDYNNQSTKLYNLFLTNTTITGNNSSSLRSAGGGIYIRTQGIPNTNVEVINSTIYDNRTHSEDATSNSSSVGQHFGGGGIYINRGDSTKVKIKSSILAFNNPNNFINHNYVYIIDSIDVIESLGYNIFNNNPFSINTNNDIVNIDSLTLNLLPLNFNGGNTKTLLPGLNSIAINNGNPTDLSLAQNGQIVNIRDVGAAEVNTFNSISNDFLRLSSDIFPNPNNGKFQLNSSTKTIFKIFNNLGQLVYRKDNFDFNHFVDLSCLNSGIYVIKIQNKHKVEITKLITKTN